MMLAAYAFEIPWDRQAAVARIGVIERNGVVHIADHGGTVTTGESARQVPHPHPPFDCGAGLVTQRLGRADGGLVEKPQA